LLTASSFADWRLWQLNARHPNPARMSFTRKAEAWNIDIDRYTTRIVPPSQLHRLPAPISRFLGYRHEQEQDVGNVLGAVWSFLGAFCGLAVVAAVFNHTTAIQMHHPPALIASYVSIPYISHLGW
jgi:hypothetical protein